MNRIIYIRNNVTLVFTIIFILLPFIVKFPEKQLSITSLNILFGLLVFAFIVFYIYTIISLLIESFGVKNDQI